MIDVVDLFAGPGGLGEGFSSYRSGDGQAAFRNVLSMEMEESARTTLCLRHFFRLFPDRPPKEYYDCLRGMLELPALYERFPKQASLAMKHSWRVRLGSDRTLEVRERIRDALQPGKHFVLIGGPPCQAYSLAGRSRNRGNPSYDPKKDVRQTLYVEYLQILADHRPAAFIMENVKGLLSAKLGGDRLFHRIVADLRDPAAALKREGRKSDRDSSLGYRLFSLTRPGTVDEDIVDNAVIRAEDYGVPQSRHRVILFGVRSDLGGVKAGCLKPQKEACVADVIGDLPALRSGLSKSADSASNWRACLRSQADSRWANAGTTRIGGTDLREAIQRVLLDIEPALAGRGGEFVRSEAAPSRHKTWYVDRSLEGVCNHSARGHMQSDLFRYLYAACFASQNGRSPSLADLPTDLLPNHGSAQHALAHGGHFSDRFRVQVANRPSTTIVSHISKDGHYYIHPDPRQCRSLTVREAARLQTFPDNYFFCGNRTSQYTQVGNAVPPLLARQIAAIVHDALQQAGCAS